MKLVVTGGRGQLGRSLVRRASGREVRALSRAELDICDPSAIADALARHAPDVVINAAAVTAVDAAELAPDRAFAVNAAGAGQVARACAARGIPLLHLSSDYVFDGGASTPIPEHAATAPLNAYGRSKARGEDEARAAGATIVRTSWLFDGAVREPGGFVQTIIGLALRERELRVVDDQRGRPTWADDLADALLALAALPARPPCIHVCGAEPTTWHGFAVAIVEHVAAHRPVTCERVVPIASSERAAAARRPAYSVLDTTLAERLAIPIRSWRPGLARTVAEVLG